MLLKLNRKLKSPNRNRTAFFQVFTHSKISLSFTFTNIQWKMPIVFSIYPIYIFTGITTVHIHIRTHDTLSQARTQGGEGAPPPQKIFEKRLDRPRLKNILPPSIPSLATGLRSQQWPSWLSWQSVPLDSRVREFRILTEGLGVTCFANGLGRVLLTRKISLSFTFTSYQV